MIKYEYKISDVDVKQTEKILNDLGGQGWELTSISEASTSIIRLFLKRPIPSGTLALLGAQ